MQKRNNRLAFGDSTLEVFLTDLHYPDIFLPYQDLSLQVVKYFQPSIIWCNGDWLDAKQISTFVTDPKSEQEFQRDIDLCHEAVGLYKKASPNAEVHWKDGNHEKRVRKYILTHARALASLRSYEIPTLLGLKDFDTIYHPNDEKSKIGRLWHLHGDELAVGTTNPARIMLERTNENVIFGHVHKFSLAHNIDLTGVNRMCFSIGCGQDISKVTFDFLPRWMNGFGVIEYSKSGYFHVTQVPIFKDGAHYYCIVYGQLFKS